MLVITTSFFATLLATWLTPAKRLWEFTTAMSLTTALLSIAWLQAQASPYFINDFTMIDEISAPLVILTCWLTPATLLASQSKISKGHITRQRIFISTTILLQVTTLMAFLASNLFLFFIFFESTIIPTLILITRWGTQKQRMLAGIYLVFYTMLASVPLLTALLYFHELFGTLSMPILKLNSTPVQPEQPLVMWWAACLIAFLVKMPLYGLHLWLPKAHVEAPIAGSMILAGTLLKLGGYGILRVNTMIPNSFNFLSPPLIVFSMLGILLSAALCTRQTDLKSLIAFSSVSHMGLVIAASLIKTDWSIAGAMILMISHGLVSSTMFCLANMSYERTNTRTLLMLQGSQTIFPLLSAWWLLTTLMNMALPPTLNFTAELSILTALFLWSAMTILIASLSIVFTVAYSLYLFWSTQRQKLPPHVKNLSPLQTREHFLILIHITPAILISLNPNLIF